MTLTQVFTEELFNPARQPLRSAVGALTRAPETEVVPALIEQARLPLDAARRVETLARDIAEAVRHRAREGSGLVQNLLQQYALSSQEGIALMCLAEALLRIPDGQTRDALIREKIGSGDWRAHLGGSSSLFVNAATWGLLLTGKLVATHSDAGLSAALRRIVSRGGEPLVRAAVDRAMRVLGEQFVTGETIDRALANAQSREAQGYRFSYDMLGEAALTAADAQAYFVAYERAIEAIGIAAAGRGIYEGPGISIKLSALHPRYSRAQWARVREELYPRLLALAQRARGYDIGLNIDAEESERLELSLALIDQLCREPSMAGWNGVGFVVQAYSKRCPAVIDVLIDLARVTRRRLMVRLVKGAYWDSEIKRTQLEGLDDYPVYTRKVYTDIAYLACARKLLGAPDAVFPQFATHNAQTVASIIELAGANFFAGQYEFQCLHGMGEPLYDTLVAIPGLADDPARAQRVLPQGRPCRIYAPVGSHETLLAYLVRRLLENGANSSFVNRIANENVPIDELVRDPVAVAEQIAAREGRLGAPHPAIVRPQALYGARENSRGLDLSDEATLARVAQWLAPGTSDSTPDTPLAEVSIAVDRAERAAVMWGKLAPEQRADALEAAAALLQDKTPEFIRLLVREAGKTVNNAHGEIREAVDFLRYYAHIVRTEFDVHTHRPLGVCVCISPWNFPLAIFLGQVAAALAAGNTVIAKPAEQTPLIARAAVACLHEAGFPEDVVLCLPGPGETVGAALVADSRVQAVLFTGSTEVARLLQRSLAQRLNQHGQPVVLIAETGGQNTMIVDSSALLEQVTADVLVSAFDSAGQRCSALRVLCVQDEVADKLLAMIEGAMAQLRIGDPGVLTTDIGPLIDAPARAAIIRHIDAMRAAGRRVIEPCRLAPELANHGHFLAPVIIEINSLAELEQEVFGPVLHVLRFRRDTLPDLLESINASGYGLTLGVHTRIDEMVAQVVRSAHVGNLYVNRNMVGAVVGVQPFGGEGLSGTGPKAGGPLYLLRVLSDRPDDSARHLVQRQTEPFSGGSRQVPLPVAPGRSRDRTAAGSMPIALAALAEWAGALENCEEYGLIAELAQRLAHVSPVSDWRLLRSATGEQNLYAIRPRSYVLCLAENDVDRLAQLTAVLAVGALALWPADTGNALNPLPDIVRDHVVLVQDWTSHAVSFEVVLVNGATDKLVEIQQRIAHRPGAIVTIEAAPIGQHRYSLERLVTERSLSINTAAAGGNASLMTLQG